MKSLYWTITASATFALLTISAFQAFARPTEPDYPCYIKTTSGQIINLTAMCESNPVAAAVPVVAANSQKERPQLQKQGDKPTRNSGQVVETARNIQGNGSGSWTLSGKVHNQTQQPVSGLQLTLNIQDGAQTVTQTIVPTQTNLKSGGYADFQTQVNLKDPNHRPDFRVASVRWRNEDGSAGVYP